MNLYLTKSVVHTGMHNNKNLLTYTLFVCTKNSVVRCYQLALLTMANLGPVSQNQDKGLSRDFPVILDSVSRKRRHINHHGDLFCTASLLLTRLTARIYLILEPFLITQHWFYPIVIISLD